jgi:hypothetical protein
MNLELLRIALPLFSLATGAASWWLRESRWGRGILAAISILSGMAAAVLLVLAIPAEHRFWPAVAITALGLGGLAWAGLAYRRRHRRHGQKRDPKLSVRPSKDALLYAFPWEGARQIAADEGREFCLLTVRNQSEANLHGVVAHVVANRGSGNELPCFWSDQPGKKYVPSGTSYVDLGVGHERVLVVAQVFSEEQLWARLPADPGHLFYVPVARSREYAREGRGRKTSPAEEFLDLGRKVRLVATFEAEGLRQVEEIQLDFDADGPIVERITPPAGPQLPKSGS